MDHSKLRRQIAWEAARLMYDRSEAEYYHAKMKAARRVCKDWVKPADLPSNAEIRDEIRLMTRVHESGVGADDRLLQMRLEALTMMERLHEYRPNLIGSVCTGYIREGSDIDLHLFANSIEPILQQLENEVIDFQIERKRVDKAGESRLYTHIHVRAGFPIEMTVYPRNLSQHRFKCSITGKAMDRMNRLELRACILNMAPQTDIEQELQTRLNQIDRFQFYASILYPLERVEQSPVYHPEGDALYHSLQVFDLAYELHPYDEEFMLAALLHDVGKAVDPGDHVLAGLEVLEGFITPRTAWLIEHHMEAHAIRNGTIGKRAQRRLKVHPDYAELIQLGEIDRKGRRPGAQTRSVEAALEVIRELGNAFQDPFQEIDSQTF